MPDRNRPTHPRPQLRRNWTSLDGTWEFARDPGARWSSPPEVTWDGTIRVPFAPETEASGVAESGFYKRCWYRLRLPPAELKPHERLHVHFGAVDYESVVWANGARVAAHRGGYTPFHADVTTAAAGGGPVELVVRADDDPHDLAKPRGKQDWQLHPHSIWYPRATGIWQPVWLERVPAVRIGRVRWTPTLERWEIGLEAFVHTDGGPPPDGLRLRAVLTAGPVLLADDTYRVVAGEVHRRIALSDPGIDDYRNELLWSPERPTLINAHLQLLGPDGAVVDEAWSYTALRSIAVQGDRFVLNGRPLALRLVLDQGYWPGTGQTAPDDDALRRDVELTKAMGFNGVRKHQKIEDPRYLYWADALGLLVWEEMPSAYRFNTESVERLTAEWAAVIERDRSHPCVIAWVPFNESWGVPDLPDSPAQRNYVRALYFLTKTLDPARPVVGNDGWESVATDVIGIHDYDDQLERIAARYGAADDLSRLFRRERPGGRMLVLGDAGAQHPDHPVVLTEFGGIAYSPDVGAWGYSRVGSTQALADRYSRLLAVVRALPVLSGFCYTQFADTYQEANGLLFADRTPKFPLADIARATRGPTTAQEHEQEQGWRDELMHRQRAGRREGV
ncbi:Beta-galactosidase [Gemmata obscuriglobus]|uniref:Glycoside hydrolase family 2 n=1 Tax=Gemmata obscuriglobus TaxID=114 RepID=A0A2Z3H7Y4_9BACT|nr:glycoside hydrolase family 2 TIM barrel-domain containing protein [Gemmata obscuriglobus]AWM39095.1 glycoside hydrolase family 2 [Gemmata obscuriglobus]QEG27867.1 Beta-galactosidase [Gemmata obscuriglobus]VTS05260.1 glycoside hydrolase family 2 sugar binding protein : Glycoside hydrolase family 2, sugar binding OS=Solibacter usitatus (strain Ellin6076) GN=Acid_0351 PE=4 SV=1: Glyco_hydro_2_N: Glyco_hydro_2_C [Gemmata obscuriglobus UQM 2246]